MMCTYWYYSEITFTKVKSVKCNEVISLLKSHSDTTPSPKLGPRWPQLRKCESLGNLRVRSQLPTIKGVRGRAESSGIRLGRRTSYLVIQSCIQNQPTSWLELILHIFGVGTSHEQPWTHLTHHGPDSWEATIFPHIVFYALLRGTRIQMAFIPRTPKKESRNCPCWDSWDFGSS